MSISTPFIRRPVATSLLTAALVLVGLAAYPFLPVAPLPRVEFPTISVSASFRRLHSRGPARLKVTVDYRGNGYIAPVKRTDHVTAG